MVSFHAVTRINGPSIIITVPSEVVEKFKIKDGEILEFNVNIENRK